MLSPSAIGRIESYVSAGIAMRCESVMADAHVMWWDTRDMEDADFVVINRNGNCNRAVKSLARGWNLAKGLGKVTTGPFAIEEWEVLMSMPTLKQLAQICWLPDDETLSFLPKLLSPKGRRKMIFRDQLVTFCGGAGDGFNIDIGGVVSPLFGGEPWKSTAAADWCLMMNSTSPTSAPKSAEGHLIQVKAEAVAQIAEDSLAGLWGSF